MTRTRKMLHATAGAVAVLAAISAGAGISAASSTESAADLAVATQTSPYQWSVQNYTGQVLNNGHWTVSEAGGASSSIGFGDSPVLPGRAVNATQEYGGKALTWEAAVCYKGKVWSSKPSRPKVNTTSPATFKLIVNDGGLVVSSPGRNYSEMQAGDACD